MTTFELPGCVDMWTVLSGDQVIDLISMDDDDDDDDYNEIQYNTAHFYEIKMYYVRKHKRKLDK